MGGIKKKRGPGRLKGLNERAVREGGSQPRGRETRRCYAVVLSRTTVVNRARTALLLLRRAAHSERGRPSPRRWCLCLHTSRRTLRHALCLRSLYWRCCSSRLRLAHNARPTTAPVKQSQRKAEKAEQEGGGTPGPVLPAAGAERALSQGMARALRKNASLLFPSYARAVRANVVRSALAAFSSFHSFPSQPRRRMDRIVLSR